jgi:6-phosphogluconolactonase
MLHSEPMGEREIVVCRDVEDLNQRAAEHFVTISNRSVDSSGRFTVALSGGSTPKGLYSRLAQAGYRERIPWCGIHFFWGDERCVPPDHPESNYRMVYESLLSKIDVLAENVHRMKGEKEPAVAAAEYEAELKNCFNLPAGSLPRFDLVLLGIGEDGHTASLFPGSDALDETERLVVAPFVEKLGAHRLTLTLPVLNHAAQIDFLVAGQSKGDVLKELLEVKGESSRLPAARIQPRDGQLFWFITQDAAEKLKSP